MNMKNLKMALATAITLVSVQSFASSTNDVGSIWSALKETGVFSNDGFVKANQNLATVNKNAICELRESASQATFACGEIANGNLKVTVIAEDRQAVELASFLQGAGLLKVAAGVQSGAEKLRQFSVAASQCIKTSRTFQCQ